MEIQGWNERYRLRQRTEDLESPPTPLVVATATDFAAAAAKPISGNAPRKALDLACGTGRNALWLAEHGWDVTAVDGASSAIDILQTRAAGRGLQINAVVADLEKGEFEIEPARWNLIAICYYLQRNLFEPAKRGVAPGGLLISIVHVTEPGEEEGPHRLLPGQLQQYFAGWEILHYHEGKATDAAHHRTVAEIVARRPRSS